MTPIMMILRLWLIVSALWVVFFYPRHTVHKEVPGDPTSIRGVFSDLDIASRYLLVDIMWNETLIYAAD